MGNSETEVSEGVIKGFADSLARRLTERLIERRDRPHFSLSQAGVKCDRQLWYRINQPEKGEALSPSVRLKFLFGDLLEDLLLFLSEVSGHKVKDRQKEVLLEEIPGHIDATIDGILIDTKSASSRSFDKFKEGLKYKDDSFGYLDQLNSYSKALGIPEAAFLVLDKQHGHIHLDKHEFLVDDISYKIQHKKEMLQSLEAPERGFQPIPDGVSGNMKLPLNCSYCEMKKHCHPGLRVFLYSNGPKFLTTVKREPDVREVT